MYRQLKESTGHILAFKIVVGITQKQKEQISKLFEKRIRESGRIRLLIVVEPHKRINAESLLFDLSFTLTYADKIERMAIIGNKVWEKTWIALFGLFSHIQTQYFDRSQIKTAWKWIHN